MILPRAARAGCLALVGWLAACGGDSGSSTPPPHTVPVTLDQGPAALISSGTVAANAPFVSVTLCTPGSTTACQTIDHVLVDTGSVGLRIVHEALSGAAAPKPVTDAHSGLPLSECLLFADGFAWGSVATADVTIGGRAIPGLVFQIPGDPASGTAPNACSSGNGPDESTVAQFGSNGVLGVGYFLEDCGAFCASQVPSGGAPFYACSAGGGDQGCTAVTVPTANQPSNPIGQLSTDNNGIQLRFPPVAGDSATTVSGTLVFGIGTEDDNGLGSATLHPVDATDGTLSTSYGGTSFPSSVIDSGSTAYYFADSSIPECPGGGPGRGFYCPASTVARNATITGTSGPGVPVAFSVANAEQVFTAAPSAAAFPALGGPFGNLQLPSGTFDWGMPFFFGRSVFVVFENRSAGSVQGPALGF